MNKKVLQIQTNFLEEEEPHSPPVTTSKINYQDQLEAATLFEKILSIILARNFIDCWATLKQYHPPTQQLSRPINNNQIYNIQNRSHKNQVITRETQQRVRYFQTKQQNIQKPRSRSYAARLHRLHTEQLTQQEAQIKSNKSARLINQQIQHSRASILQEIVQKLKNIRKVNEMQENNNNQSNEEVLRKITYLERMIRNMRNQRVHTDYETPDRDGHYHKNKYIQQRQNIHIQHKSVESSQEDEQLMKTFLGEIELIKKQIGQIKSNNQAILKSQLERSRASSASARHNHRHRDNNYFIPVQMIPPYMNFNPNYLHGLNPNIAYMNHPTHDRNLQGNFKGEQNQSRTRQQQTNSRTQALSQVPTQSELQNTKTNLNNYMNTEVKKTISEGVQTHSIQKNTIYTETEDTKHKNSQLKKYNEQLDEISRNHFNNIYQKPKSKQTHQIHEADQKYRRPYTTQPKRQIDLQFQKSYDFSFKNTDETKNRYPSRTLSEQGQIQTKLKFPTHQFHQNNHTEGDNIMKPKEKLYPSSTSSSNQNSGLNYNIPVAEIALLMKKIEKINDYVQNQSKTKNQKQYQPSNKSKFQDSNHVPIYNSATKYELRNNSVPVNHIQPTKGGQYVHTNQPQPSSIHHPQVYKMQPSIQFYPNQSQAYIRAPPPCRPPVFQKPQTHSISLSIPQQTQTQTRPITITRQPNHFVRGDQIKSNGTFYSKNNVYSEMDSSYSFGLPLQRNHYRKPSIQFYTQNNRPNISFTNYCSLCGRHCGCPRSFTNIPRN